MNKTKEKKVKCPKCNSNNVKRAKDILEEFEKKSNIAMVKVGEIPEFICFSCDFMWEITSKGEILEHRSVLELLGLPE